MLYIVFTTGRCNLRCSYCGGSFPEDVVPWEVKYDLRELLDFVSRDSEPVVAFYGGEPLLNVGFIRRVMDSLEARYVIQTNGLLVRELEPDYWLRFRTVLLSIDGVEWLTDLNRGRGVYRRVVEAAGWLREIGFRGDLVARMTLTERGDVYRDVTHLLRLGLFDHVHWQLNVVWSPPWRDFRGWLERSYKPGLSRLVKLWMRELRSGRVLGIAPVQGVLKRLMEGGPAPPCGSGVESLSVLTDGTILACPIAVDVEWARLGRLGDADPERLVGRVRIGEPCTGCPIFRACGGRCLYAHRERLWGMDGFRMVCEATRHLVEEVEKVRPEVEELVAEGRVRREDVLYPEFNNTVEIIP